MLQSKIDDLTEIIESVNKKSNELRKSEQKSINKLFDFNETERETMLESIAENVQELQKVNTKLDALKSSLNSSKNYKEIQFENEVEKNVQKKEIIKNLRSNPLCTMFHVEDDAALDIEIARIKQATNVFSQRTSFRLNP